jgi:chromosome segregation ATPase
MKVSVVLLGLLFASQSYGEYNSYSSTVAPSTNPNVEAVRASLEGLRDKLSTPELTTLKAAVSTYLNSWDAANGKVNTARADVEKLNKTEIPALLEKLKPLEEKKAQYLAGKLKEEEYKSHKDALDKLEMEVAAARAKLIEREAALTPIQAEFAKAEKALADARAPVKAMEDKLLTAMAQSLAGMTLQQNLEAVKVDGLGVANKLDLIEVALADTVLEGYVRAKMAKLLVSPELCKGVKACSGYSSEKPNPDLKDVFPGKTH